MTGLVKKTLFSVFLLIFVLLSFSESLDMRSSEQLDTAFKRSVVTFALARGLNGLVSVVQGTEVSLAPAGMGVNIAAGEILDPVNDMVERFSWVMLMSSVSLGAQEVMLHLGKTFFFKTVFTLTAAVFLLLYWLPMLRRFKGLYEWSFKSLLILGLLRFSVPLLVMINTAVYDAVLAERYDQSSQRVLETSDAVKVMIDEVGEDERSTEASLLDSFNLEKRYDAYKQKVEETIESVIKTFNASMESIIDLITVFIINTVLVPLAALWLFVYGIGAIVRRADIILAD
jgi:hypothetical protein